VGSWRDWRVSSAVSKRETCHSGQQSECGNRLTGLLRGPLLVFLEHGSPTSSPQACRAEPLSCEARLRKRLRCTRPARSQLARHRLHHPFNTRIYSRLGCSACPHTAMLGAMPGTALLQFHSLAPALSLSYVDRLILRRALSWSLRAP